MSHRGPHPEDARLFDAEAIARMRLAHRDALYLLDRGYPINAVLELVGNRFALEGRQRGALRRGACTTEARDARAAKKLPWEAALGAPVAVDGFNLLITLETAFGGGVIVTGYDTATRDLAGLHGTYHIVDETLLALDAIGRAVALCPPDTMHIWLDAPVSNSGRLSALWRERAATWRCPVEVALCRDADRELVGAGPVVSCDAAVIEASRSWIDLIGHVIDREATPSRRLRLDDDRPAGF